MHSPIPPPIWLEPDPEHPSVLRPAPGSAADGSAASTGANASANPSASHRAGPSPAAATSRAHPARAAAAHPTMAFMASHPAHAIALGFGAGLARRAPGTVGTLWAWAAFLVMQPWLSDWGWAAVIAVGLLVGWWACTVTARHMGQPDSSHMVWDEVVAFWLVLWVLAPAGFWTQAYAFALFRLFDAVKFGPMAWADQAFKGFGPRGGFGVMLDDLAAAFCTLLVIAWWRF